MSGAAKHDKRALLAPFATAQAIVEAAHALHARGYRELDAFVPRPVEELEALIAPVRSSLRRSVFAASVLGALTGLGVQWFCNAWDYPLNVGGRPPFSLPAFIPIAFEATVLFGAAAAFFGVLHRMGLPRLSHPLFEVAGFERASIDQYWLYVGANDAQFQAGPVEDLLREHGALAVSWTPATTATPAEHAPDPGAAA
jgi:hypothetical protein